MKLDGRQETIAEGSTIRNKVTTQKNIFHRESDRFWLKILSIYSHVVQRYISSYKVYTNAVEKCIHVVITFLPGRCTVKQTIEAQYWSCMYKSLDNCFPIQFFLQDVCLCMDQFSKSKSILSFLSSFLYYSYGPASSSCPTFYVDFFSIFKKYRNDFQPKGKFM